MKKRFLWAVTAVIILLGLVFSYSDTSLLTGAVKKMSTKKLSTQKTDSKTAAKPPVVIQNIGIPVGTSTSSSAVTAPIPIIPTSIIPNPSDGQTFSQAHAFESTTSHQQMLDLLNKILLTVSHPPSCPVVYQQIAPAPAATPTMAPEAAPQVNSSVAEVPPLSITNGMVLYYNFETFAGNGAVIDMSGHGNFGTALNTATEQGPKGQALAFNGTNASVIIGGGKNLDIASRISLAAWVKFSGTIDDWRFIYKRSGNYGVDLVNSKNGGFLEFSFADSTGTVYSATSQAEYNDDQWHHVVGTYDGTAMKLYVDGALVTSIPLVGAAIYYQTPFSAIGRNGNEGGRFWNGSIDEMRVYDRALSEEEVKLLYAF